jgi:hypothetical protein
MGNRPLTFAERREQLADGIATIDDAIRGYEDTKRIYHLQNVAAKLRALVVYEAKSNSLNHPLLLELAAERRYPLVLYCAYAIPAPPFPPSLLEGMVFDVQTDAFALERDAFYRHEISLDIALDEEHATILGKTHTSKALIRAVAEREAVHYDPKLPPDISNLAIITVDNLPVHYSVVYRMGRIVRELGNRFLQATA